MSSHRYATLTPFAESLSDLSPGCPSPSGVSVPPTPAAKPVGRRPRPAFPRGAMDPGTLQHDRGRPEPSRPWTRGGAPASSRQRRRSCCGNGATTEIPSPPSLVPGAAPAHVGYCSMQGAIRPVTRPRWIRPKEISPWLRPTSISGSPSRARDPCHDLHKRCGVLSEIRPPQPSGPPITAADPRR
jgi:hypothetical protein